MKYEKYFTFDGEVMIWPADNMQVAAMAYLQEKKVCHRRRIDPGDGSRLGLMALRTNKDDLGGLAGELVNVSEIFDTLDMPGFKEIKQGAPDEKHGKHSWDKHDATEEVARLERVLDQMDLEDQRLTANIVSLNVRKTELAISKEQAIQAGEADKIPLHNRALLEVEAAIAKDNLTKAEIAAEKSSKQDAKAKEIIKKDTAQAGLDGLGG